MDYEGDVMKTKTARRILNRNHWRLTETYIAGMSKSKKKQLLKMAKAARKKLREAE